MKASNPYGATDTYRIAPDTITREKAKAEGKAKARYPHKPLSTSTRGSGSVTTKLLKPT